MFSINFDEDAVPSVHPLDTPQLKCYVYQRQCYQPTLKNFGSIRKKITRALKNLQEQNKKGKFVQLILIKTT